MIIFWSFWKFRKIWKICLNLKSNHIFKLNLAKSLTHNIVTVLVCERVQALPQGSQTWISRAVCGPRIYVLCSTLIIVRNEPTSFTKTSAFSSFFHKNSRSLCAAREALKNMSWRPLLYPIDHFWTWSVKD